MKRLAPMGLILLVALFVSTAVHAGPAVNEGKLFCTDPDLDSACDSELFTTKFWKEKFFGGGPGQPGNVLMAKGKGFMLQNMVLQEVAPCDSGDCGLPAEDPCYATDWEYKTTYEGGMLTLNSKGPWLDKGMLKAKGLTATNYSRGRGEDGNLQFCLVIAAGEFRNAQDFTFNAVARFDATSDPGNYQFKVDDEGNPVFQRGYSFDALIEIVEK